MESIFVLKIFKILKNCATLFWRLSSQSRPQSWKRFRKISKFWVCDIFTTQFGDWFTSGSSSCEFYSKSFAAPLTTFSQVDLPVTKITWTNFSKFVTQDFVDLNWWLVRDSLQSQKTRVLHNEGYFQGTYQKIFIFPSHIVIVHCLPLLNSPCSLTKPPFSSSSLHQSSRKGMGSLFFSKYFMFLALDF